jgi:hypothetical protein
VLEGRTRFSPIPGAVRRTSPVVNGQNRSRHAGH